MPTMLSLLPMMILLNATGAAPPGDAKSPLPQGTIPQRGAAPQSPATDPTKPDPAHPDTATPDATPGKPAPVAAPGKSDPGHTLAPPAVPFPHPMISEVLFAVPSTGESDANKSGKREVSGDEFVELVNPHDRSIQLKGYTITDGSPSAKTTLRFTFPALTLPPRGVVVVFNGHEAKIPGPVGDARNAAAGINENFHKAAIFAIRPTSSRMSFSNAGDAACLKAPDGKLLQRVRWGKADEKAGGTGFVLDEIAPTSTKGSVQRDSAGKDGAWKTHVEIDSSAFSPGAFAPLEKK